ncbi:MAG: Adaptor for signal transduction [Lichina confinis]|nr:MAG: Adaptor for signal transduction [Lichina confinis]
MPFQPAYEDSDADDEYERSVVSPPLATDSETSPTDSEPPSTENTPTVYGNLSDDKLPRTIITEWTAEECADYVSGLGLSQYADAFLENDIVGEALIALKHEELKEMGVTSVGHRLTLLKSVYDIKIRQDIPVDPEHYVPLSADAGMQDAVATQEDVARIIQSIQIRDERIVLAERELRRLTEEYRRLREDLLPVFRMAKESQPLPFPAGATNDAHSHDQAGSLHPLPQLQPEKLSLSRKFSHNLTLGSTPKNASPTHGPPLIPENKAYVDGGGGGGGIDPSAAAIAASNSLHASVSGGGGSQPSASPGQPPNMPSPTSPPSYKDAVNQSPIMPRPNNSLQQQPPPPPPPPPLSGRGERFDDPLLPTNVYSHPTPTPHGNQTSNAHAPRSRADGGPGDGGGGSGGGGAPPSVEIFKSFRVSMEDPCYKVLPAALERYRINADWREYALYIVHGDEERCLQLDEKPLILFKQLDREGRKPMFMLRKINAAPSNALSADAAAAGAGGPSGQGAVNTGGVGVGQVGNQPGSAGLPRDGSARDAGHPGGSGPGGAGASGGMTRGMAYQSGVTLPGGVL